MAGSQLPAPIGLKPEIEGPSAFTPPGPDFDVFVTPGPIGKNEGIFPWQWPQLSELAEHRHAEPLEPGEGRGLTSREIRMARAVFGDAIDYHIVTVFRKKFIFFHPSDRAMAPDGNIYFHPDDPGYRDDFSCAEMMEQYTFIHELTHVWQDQTGVNVIWRGIFEREYEYVLDVTKPLADYDIEQQGSIVADYFALREYNLRMNNSQGSPPPTIADYEAVLPFTPA